ncbi:efflux RND transporter periplasmic adaptor subunit [Schinkia sp. CFF1]
MRTQRVIINIAICFSLSLLLAGCNNAEQQEAKKESKTIKAETVTKELGMVYSTLSGTLAAKEESYTSFEIGGVIESLPFEEGQFVNKGVALARINSRDYELQLEKANAAIQSSSASVSAAQAGLEEAKNGARQQERIQAKLAVVRAEEAYKNASTDYERMKKLFESGAISVQVLEGAKLNYINAETSYENTKQSYSLIEEGVRPEQEKQMQASVNQAKASLLNANLSKQQAQLALEKTSLIAPFSGVIVKKLASNGELISPGIPVYTIAQIDTLRLLLPVPDYQIADWNIGENVELELYEDHKLGKVINIFPATNEKTGTISVELEIPNNDHKWFPGQVVKAKAKLKEKQGIYVPVEAVISTGTKNKPYVFLFKNGKAVKTEVTVGALFEDKIEITSGLSVDEKVITKGADHLFDGDQVTVEIGEGTKKQ